MADEIQIEVQEVTPVSTIEVHVDFNAAQAAIDASIAAQAALDAINDILSSLGVAGLTILPTETTTSYIFQLSDANGLKPFSNTGNKTATIPPNASVPFLLGTVLIAQKTDGDGNTTLTGAAGEGVTIIAPLGLAIKGQTQLKFIKIATDTWLAFADVFYGYNNNIIRTKNGISCDVLVANGGVFLENGLRDPSDTIRFIIGDGYGRWVSNKPLAYQTNLVLSDEKDLVHVAHVNALLEGIKTKETVKAATTANITLSGTQTIDGVALAVNDRVLVKDQTTASQNGIYLVKSGSWIRSTDADTATELTNAVVTVLNGTSNIETTFRQSSTSITLGTTAIVWVTFGANIPDATSSTKGKAKLYNDLGASNTDGAPTQAAVKALKDSVTPWVQDMVDANIAPASTTRILQTTVDLTEDRTVTLPLGVPAGEKVTVIDSQQTVYKDGFKVIIEPPAGKQLNKEVDGIVWLGYPGQAIDFISDGTGNFYYGVPDKKCLIYVEGQDADGFFGLKVVKNTTLTPQFTIIGSGESMFKCAEFDSSIHSVNGSTNDYPFFFGNIVYSPTQSDGGVFATVELSGLAMIFASGGWITITEK